MGSFYAVELYKSARPRHIFPMRWILSLLFCCLSASFAAAHHVKTFNYINKPDPVIPAAAYRSGYCCMTHDILPTGKTSNVEAGYCTDELFKAPSIKAVSGWVYETKRKDDSPVTAKYLTAKIAYRIDDYQGVPISGPNSFLTPLPEGGYYQEFICSPLIG